MGRAQRIIIYIIIAWGCAGVVSCSSFIKPRLIPFEEAIANLTTRLLNQIKTDPSTAGKETIDIMIIPFADADSGEVPEVSRSIEKIMIATGKRDFKRLHLARLTSKNISHADYIINGTIRLESYQTLFAKRPSRNYFVHGKVRQLADPKIIGKAGVWIAEMNLDYTPTAIYKDSPLYLQGSTMTQPAQVRYQPYEEDFLDISLKTRAMLIEARMAYEHKDYEAAEALFSMAARRKDGQDLGTYAGLYLANHKLGRLDKAEEAFAKVVSISVEKYRFLTVKYLFGVNSVDFLQNENLKARYDTWLRHIGRYFHNTNYCLRIVGHASRTGTEAYNNKLSLERAKSIQQRLQKTFPEVLQRSEVVGKGFSKNIVGIGTDDERDALDRRVELFIVDCNYN